MAARQVHLLLGDVRRLDADVAGGELGFLRQFFQFLADRSPFRQPHRQTGADVFRIYHIQAHLLTDLPVVAFLRFFDHFEILVELGPVLERGPVDAL